jgi:dephospho-CoA kinase
LTVKAGKPVIGLAGGIGSGKSAAAKTLADLGAGVIDSDQLNHEELNQPEVLDELRRWWGDRVTRPDRTADRAAIREIVADDAEQRQRLERLVHPRIARRREEYMKRYECDPRIRAIVWDSPLLYEAGLAEKCDCVIFVDADEEVRRTRVCRERGWTPEHFEAMQKSQTAPEIKRADADYRVVNDSDLDTLRRQLEDVLHRILSGA